MGSEMCIRDRLESSSHDFRPPQGDGSVRSDRYRLTSSLTADPVLSQFAVLRLLPAMSVKPVVSASPQNPMDAILIVDTHGTE